ncbi:MAG TPA: hypothetical protein VGC42_23140, partial [Kofleriaceae bacterium]
MVEREGVEHDERVRHHVLGHAREQVIAQLLVAGRGARDDIGDEAGVAAGVGGEGEDEGLSDGGVSAQGGLDFAGLDAEAADLELVVG